MDVATQEIMDTSTSKTDESSLGKTIATEDDQGEETGYVSDSSLNSRKGKISMSVADPL